MKVKDFIHHIDKERLVAAIQEAERGNSGDVVLFVSQKPVEDALVAAHAEFKKLKLAETTPQNSVLIYVAPKSQKLAVLGGADLYKVLPPEWWTELVATITRSFAANELTEGLLAGLKEIGNVQRQHFPKGAAHNRAGQKDLLEEG